MSTLATIISVITCCFIAFLGAVIMHLSSLLKEAEEDVDNLIGIARNYETITHNLETDVNNYFRYYRFCRMHEDEAEELYKTADHIRNHVYLSEDYKDKLDRVADILFELGEISNEKSLLQKYTIEPEEA